MPLIAQDTLKPKKIFLPTSKDLAEEEKEWVVLEVGEILGADVIDMDSFESVTAFKYHILCNRLLEWNVKDTDGEVAKINKDTVKRLPFEDLAFLMKEVDTEVEAVTLPKELPNS